MANRARSPKTLPMIEPFVDEAIDQLLGYLPMQTKQPAKPANINHSRVISELDAAGPSTTPSRRN